MTQLPRWFRVPRKLLRRLWLRGFLPALLLFGLWVFSLGAIIVWHRLDAASRCAAIGHGSIIVQWGMQGGTGGFGTPSWGIGSPGATFLGPPRHWYFTSWWDAQNVRLAAFRLVVQPGYIEVSLLYSALVSAVWPAIRLYRVLRRKPPGSCVKCGYDLSGLVGETCPECGSAARVAPLGTG